jgi:TPR repeat protein/ankyrin repeat protein
MEEVIGLPKDTSNHLNSSLQLDKTLKDSASKVEPLAGVLARMKQSGNVALDYPEVICTRSLKVLLAKADVKMLLDPLLVITKDLQDLAQQFTTAQEKKDANTLINAYQAFIQSVREADPKECRNLLKGCARLYGMENVYQIPRKQARTMASIDKFNQLSRTNAFGASAVNRVGDAHIKRAHVNPLKPGWEFAVDCFGRQLFKQGTTPTRFLVLKDTWVSDPFGENSRGTDKRKELAKLQVSKKDVQEIFSEHDSLRMDYPFEEIRARYLLQAGKSVNGLSLLEFLEEGDPLKLSEESASVQFCLAILLRRSDDRADNFQVDDQDAIVGIDNDHALGPVIEWQHKLLKLNLRSILLLLPQRNDPLSKGVVDRLLEVDAEELVLNWLHELDRQNAFYAGLKQQCGLTDDDFDRLSLPIAYHYSAIAETYKFLVRLKEVIAERPNAGRWEIFWALYPAVAALYERILKQAGEDPLKGQNLLFPGMSPCWVQEFVDSNEPLYEELKALASDSVDESRLLPQQLAERWLADVRVGEWRGKEQKTCLERVLSTFPKLNHLHVRDFSLDDDELVQFVGKAKHLKAVTLDRANVLTETGILTLLQRHPKMELVLGPCEQIDSSHLENIARTCWEGDQKISLLLGSGAHQLTKESLDAVLCTAVAAENFPYAEGLVGLGAKWDQVNEAKESLLHQAARLESVEPLRFLLKQELGLEGRDQYQQTPLHHAVKEGSLAHIELYLKAGADIKALDKDGKNVLHLAANRGDPLLVELLIQEGADHSAHTSGGYTPLQLATEKGRLEFAKAMLDAVGPELFRKLLSLKDDDGKRPLHTACWVDEKTEFVEFFIGQGADVNATNNWGYTAAHWAAKHAHLNSLKRLIEADAKLNIANDNGHLPLDLALRWRQDRVVLYLIDPAFSDKLGEINIESKDLEGAYWRALVRAKEEGRAAEQVFYILQLSDLVLAKGEYKKAAILTNGALDLATKHRLPKPLEDHLFKKLESIEGYFLSEVCKRKTPVNDVAPLKNYREQLAKTRAAVEAALAANTMSIDKALSTLTDCYRKLFVALIESTVNLMGEPPTEYACIWFGSAARGEMCRNSDLEWAILLKEDTKENRAYFRKIARLVHLKVANIGETSVEIQKGQKLCSDGFCIDSRINPVGVRELIGSPEALAAIGQKPKGNLALANALICSDHLVGSEKLVKQYEKAIENGIDGRKFGFGVAENRKTMVFELLKAGIREYEPNLSDDRWEIVEAFGVKQDLYRPIQELIAALALYYKIEEKNTVARIRKLADRKILSAKGAKHLADAVREVYRLRLETHCYYKDENEIIHFPVHGKKVLEHKIGKKALVATDSHRKQIVEIYRTIIPFHKCVEAFVLAEGKDKSLNKANLYSKELDISAYVHHRLGDSEKAVALWTAAAKNGESAAQYNLALFYDKGAGGNQSLDDMMGLYESAADGGSAMAQYRLGLIHYKQGNIDKAAEYFRQAAYQKNAKAQYRLGRCYYNADGVDRDDEAAAKLFGLSAAQKNAKGQRQLGICYYEGRGVDQDPVQAAKFFGLAAGRGDTEAQFRLALCYLKGEGVDPDILEGVRLFGLAAAQGHAGAQLRLALFYHKGVGVDPDIKKAVEFYRLSAEQEHSLAQVNLGLCYEYAQGVNRDLKEAARLYGLSAKQNNASAQFHLALCHQKEQDQDTAVELFRLAASQKHPLAQYHLGLCYETGAGVDQSDEEAASLFGLAAEQEHLPAQLKLAECLLEGRGVAQDTKAAIELLKVATAQQAKEQVQSVSLDLLLDLGFWIGY